MKIQKRYIIFSLYLLILTILCLSTGILAKYIAEDDEELDFTVGSVLYFNYERSDLYRNNQIVPAIPSVYEENGKTYQLLETMNVAPGDSLTYHFFVSNFNTASGDQNLIDGLFYPNTNATLSLPIKGEIYNVDCTILYRQVPYDENDTSVPADGVWNNLVEGKYLTLPQTSVQKVRYEFKVTVVVDDQVQGTTHDDYFNAVLSIKLFINAASN